MHWGGMARRQATWSDQGRIMPTLALSKGLAATTAGLKFSVTPKTVTIKGDIHRSDGAIVLQDIFAGATTTPFQLPAGKYYYEFGYDGSATPAKFTVSLPGSTIDCDPSSVDPADGSLDRITNFTI